MNHLKAYPAHFLLYLVGAVDFIAQIPAIGPLAQYAPWIGAAAAVAAAIHHSFTSGAASAAAATVVKSGTATLILLGLSLALVGVSVTGCATLPTPTQNAAITTAVTVATGFTIQQKDTDPAKWQSRAKEIKLIALELKSVNDAGSATLATLAADLEPQVAKLGPADVIAVNALVATLTPILQDQIAKNPKIGNTQVAVDMILTAILTTCSAYGV